MSQPSLSCHYDGLCWPAADQWEAVCMLCDSVTPPSGAVCDPTGHAVCEEVCSCISLQQLLALRAGFPLWATARLPPGQAAALAHTVCHLLCLQLLPVPSVA